MIQVEVTEFGWVACERDHDKNGITNMDMAYAQKQIMYARVRGENLLKRP